MTTHLYACDLRSRPASAQLEAARSCLTAETEQGDEFVDEGAHVWRGALWRRPAGARLLARLKAGDVLAAATPIVLAPHSGAFLALARRLRELQVSLVLANAGSGRGPARYGPDIWDEAIRLLEGLYELQYGRRPEQIRAGMAKLKAAGARNTRGAPIGCRWQKRRGRYYAVPDELEQETIRLIVEYKERLGMSYTDITSFLEEQNVRTSSGKRWHRRRVELAYKAFRDRPGYGTDIGG